VDDATWTLAELVAEIATALRDLEPPNGQVRAQPDERAVRYYTTLGLLDRASAMRGRTALYGRRHLAQVVAIKRLQAAGKSLADIQAYLPTVDDAELTRVSGVAVPARPPGRGRAGFWRETPAEPRAARDPDPADATPGGASDGFIRQAALALAPGVTITIDVDRDTTEADADALRAAAAPLVAELRRRRLI
jgi:DNA-binding transcriptional MerR regulator